jgi:hypothetical protein
VSSEQSPASASGGPSDGAIHKTRAIASALATRARPVAARVRPSAEVARILVLWAAWLAIICAFQILVQARVAPQRPDYALGWTQYATVDPVYECQQNPDQYRPRLSDPNMNEHVAYDSEYYISIAATAMTIRPSRPARPISSAVGCAPDQYVSLSYAFTRLPDGHARNGPRRVLPFTSISARPEGDPGGIWCRRSAGCWPALARLMGSYARRRSDAGGVLGRPGGFRRSACLPAATLPRCTGGPLRRPGLHGYAAVEKKVVRPRLCRPGYVGPAGGVFSSSPWAVFETLPEQLSQGLADRDPGWPPVRSRLRTWYSSLGESGIRGGHFFTRFRPGGSWDMGSRSGIAPGPA